MIGGIVITNSDGSSRMEERNFEEPKTSNYEIYKLIEDKKHRLEELTKDFEQDRIGFVVPNIDERRQEFKTLLNEVRVLMGKEIRELKVQVEEPPESTSNTTQN